MSSGRPITNPDHGLLVAFGGFMQQHGLLDRLRQVPIAQKAHDFRPQDKLVEFLAGLTSGIEHLQDLNHGPRRVVRDTPVAAAWGLGGFAHFTRVGCTLGRCDSQTVAATEAAITAFSRPFAHATVHEWVRRGQPLSYELDLTGQAVSSTRVTYPEAAFGWMNDQVELGYQWARKSRSPRTGEHRWPAGWPASIIPATRSRPIVCGS